MGRRKSRKSPAPQNGHDAPAPPDSRVPLFHKPGHLAKRLGVSRQTVYNLVRRGELAAYDLADCWRIPEQSVLDYISRHQVKP